MLNFFFFSARLATRKQFTIDILDVWIPAAGADLVRVSEGTLGLLGCVSNELDFLHQLKPCCSLISSILGMQNQWQSVNGKK